MGNKPGRVTLRFDAFRLPNKVEIYSGSRFVYATTMRSGTTEDYIDFDGLGVETWNIKVLGNPDGGGVIDEWKLNISCPNYDNN